MGVIAFDTLKFAQTLREKGKLTHEQAEGISQAFADAAAEQLAAKDDLGNLATRTDLAEAKTEIIKWMFGTIGFQTLIILGAVIALARLIRP